MVFCYFSSTVFTPKLLYPCCQLWPDLHICNMGLDLNTSSSEIFLCIKSALDLQHSYLLVLSFSSCYWKTLVWYPTSLLNWFIVVQSLSCADSFWPHGLKPTRLFCLPLSPRVCSKSRPLSGWCCLTISPLNWLSNRKKTRIPKRKCNCGDILNHFNLTFFDHHFKSHATL